jgi:hypothetical protein
LGRVCSKLNTFQPATGNFQTGQLARKPAGTGLPRGPLSRGCGQPQANIEVGVPLRDIRYADKSHAANWRRLAAAQETKYAPARWGGRSRPNVEMHREKRARREQQHDGHQVGHLSCRATGLRLDNEHCGILPGQGGLICAGKSIRCLRCRTWSYCQCGARSVRRVRAITNERGRQLRRPYSL